MKLSQNKIGFIVSLVVMLLCFYIYFEYIQKQSYYLIDNPTDKSWVVTVDEQTYHIAPNQQVEVALEKGKHSMSSTDDKGNTLLKNTVFEVTRHSGTLNPTQAVYVTFYLPYGPKLNTDSIFRSQPQQFREKVYYGKMNVDSSSYIEHYYYGLKEKFPSITLKSENKSFRSKLFREDDFKQFYFENFE